MLGSFFSTKPQQRAQATCGFLQNTTYENRARLAAKLKIKYPDRVPIVLMRQSNSDASTPVLRERFLAPNDCTVSHFLSQVRETCGTLGPQQTIFLFVNGNTVPRQSQCLDALYAQHKSDDGFLYITYAFENVFGAQ